MADHRRTYELVQVAALTGFFIFLAGCGMSLPLVLHRGWDWGWSITLGVFAVGSLIGSKFASEYAGELRRDAAKPARVPAGSDDDWEKGEA